MTFDSNEAPKTLDPLGTATPGEERPIEAMFDTLAEMEPGSSEPQPALATSWKISKGDTTYTFQIRPNVKFSNGEELTGEDVVYSMERIAKLPISTGLTYAENWKKVSLAGPMTVRFELNSPTPILVQELTLPPFSIVPKKVTAAESEAAFAAHPVGTGPFMFKSASAGNSKISLVRNPNYWRSEGPHLDGLVFNLVESDSARILAVRSGTATVATGVPYSEVAPLKETSGVEMLVEPLWGTGLNPINNTKAPLNNQNVRLALIYATPYEEILQAVFKGVGNQPNSFWGKLKFWDSKVPLMAPDLEKAKELLAESPAAGGFNVSLQVQGGESTGELVATILQSAWAELGVHVSIHTVDFATLQTNLVSGNFQIQIYPPEGWVNEMPDPAVPARVYLGGEVLTSVQPSAATKANITKAVAALDPKSREKLFQQVQAETYSQNPSYLAFATLTSRSLVSDKLRGFQVMPDAHIPMQEIWLAH